MTTREAKNFRRRLVRRGFDKTYTFNGGVYPRCSQCSMTAICGQACHERGCPNERRTR